MTVTTYRIGKWGVLVLTVLSVISCFRGGTVEIGPIRVRTDAGEGGMSRDLFLPKGLGPIAFEQDFCGFPSEEELSADVLQVGGIDIRDFVRLSGV